MILGGGMSFTFPDPGQPNPAFERPADRAHLERTAAALTGRGFTARIADSAKEARRLVLEAIPEGAEVHIAPSETMRELGLTADIDGATTWPRARHPMICVRCSRGFWCSWAEPVH
jgi:hypothetical protein